MSNATCPICSSVKYCAILVADHEYNLKSETCYNKCEDCKSIYQHPMPNTNELGALYPEHYHSLKPDSQITKFKFKQRFKQVKRFIKSDTVFLDYGCGDGSFIEFCGKLEPSVNFVGFEIALSNEIIELAPNVKKNLGDFEYFLSNTINFNVISMNHVIEHIPNLNYVFEKLTSKLNSGGNLIGQTPNSTSLEHRLFKTKWSGYHAPRHTIIFSSYSLTLFLKNHGFVNTTVKGGFNPAGFAVSIRSIFNSKKGGYIKRQSYGWYLSLMAAVCIYPIELFGQPGIIDFYGSKK